MTQDTRAKTTKRTIRLSPLTTRFFQPLQRLTAFLVLVGVTSTLAQTPVDTPYVLTSYDIEQLASRPGTIVVGTRVTTRIEFDDQIDDVDSARQELFTIEVEQNRISLRADQNAGRTDLVVTVGGRTALFIVEINSELNAPRRYVVGVVEEPAPRVSRAFRGTRPQSRTDSRVAETTTDREGEAVRKLEPTASTPDAAIPPWLSFQAQATYAPNGVLAVTYALANGSEHDLANDATRLRLTLHDPVAGPQRLPYTLSRISLPGTINRLLPGGVEFGTLLLKDVPDGPFTLTWPLVEIGPGRTYTLRRTFHEGFVHEISR